MARAFRKANASSPRIYRLPGASEQAGGIGLGLSLVRQIASTHGGVVQCIAHEMRGSCFQVTLPA